MSRDSKSRSKNCRTALEDPRTPGYKTTAVTTQGDKGQMLTDPCRGAGGTGVYAHVSLR